MVYLSYVSSASIFLVAVGSLPIPAPTTSRIDPCVLPEGGRQWRAPNPGYSINARPCGSYRRPAGTSQADRWRKQQGIPSAQQTRAGHPAPMRREQRRSNAGWAIGACEFQQSYCMRCFRSFEGQVLGNPNSAASMGKRDGNPGLTLGEQAGSVLIVRSSVGGGLGSAGRQWFIGR
jgi:hypothetical protein